MIIIAILSVILFYVGQFIENLPSKPVAYFFNTALFLLTLYCFLDITYTADWEMYYYIFKFEKDTDFMFSKLTVLFKSFQLNFNDLYQFHILVTVSLYYLLISRFTKNIFFIFLAYIILDNIHFVNQIRYYLGFPILMLGYYFLFYKKNYIVSILLIIISILCHSGLAFLLIFIPINIFVPTKRYYYYILLFSSFVFLIALFIYNTTLGDILIPFGGYMTQDFHSSFLGGLYNAIPYIIFTVVLYKETFSLLEREPEIMENPKFRFLYKVCFFPVIFIPASFMLQIIGHRYVMTYSVFWILYYYLFFIKNQETKIKLEKFLILCGIIFICAVFIYIIPGYIFSENHFTDEFIKMIKSSDNLKELID